MSEKKQLDQESHDLIMRAIRAAPDHPKDIVEDEATQQARFNARMPLAYHKPQPETREQMVKAIAQVRDLLRYDPETGILRYRHQETPGRPGNWRSLATVKGRNGYATVKLYGMTVYAAQVVWLLHHGRWPYGRLKRRDGDTLNDRIENLREPREEPVVVPSGQRIRRNASRGVARCGEDHWQAYCRVNGKQVGLGRFDTEAEALAARAAWGRGDDLV